MQTAKSPYMRFVFPTKASKFFESLKENKLTTTRCVKCKQLNMPPRVDCPKCLGSEVEWVELSGRGKLLTYTVIEIGPESFAKFAPYTVGIVELDEGPKMMAKLVDVNREKIEIGMRLRVAFSQGFGGQPSYQFRPE